LIVNITKINKYRYFINYNEYYNSSNKKIEDERYKPIYKHF